MFVFMSNLEVTDYCNSVSIGEKNEVSNFHNLMAVVLPIKLSAYLLTYFHDWGYSTGLCIIAIEKH